MVFINTTVHRQKKSIISLKSVKQVKIYLNFLAISSSLNFRKDGTIFHAESQMKVNDLNIYRIGCFLYTKAAESALQDLKVSDESLPEFCVKTCETKNYPVAITGSSSGCFCVNTQSLYVVCCMSIVNLD